MKTLTALILFGCVGTDGFCQAGDSTLQGTNEELAKSIKLVLQSEEGNSKINSPTSSLSEATFISASEIPAHLASEVQLSASSSAAAPPDYRPGISDADLTQMVNVTSNYVVSRNLVPVNGYQRGNTYVNSYTRQPPGGITATDQLEGNLAGLAVATVALGVDYLLQSKKQQDATAQVPAKPKFPLVKLVDDNSHASRAKILAGDYIISYDKNSLGWAEPSNNPLLSKVEQTRLTGKKTAEILIYRRGNFLRAWVPAGEMIGVALTEDALSK